MEYKFEKVLSMLNKGGIDINSLVEHNNKHVSGEIFSGYKTTALHCAAFHNHYKIVELLIERGAEINIEDSNNYTAALRATQFGHYETVKLFIDKGFSDLEYLLFMAATNNYLKIAKLLIEHEADVNYNNGKILNELAYYDYAEMLELLIKNGAVVNHIDSSTNRIPLVKSIITNHDDDSDDINPFAQYLLEYPNTNIEDEILEPVYKSYLNNRITGIVEDIAKCEKLYKQSNLEELYEYFKDCDSKVQNIFLNRQKNKFNPEIKYFKNKDDLYNEATKLTKFTSNDFVDPELKSLSNSISEYITLKRLALLEIKESNIEYKNSYIPKSLIEDLDEVIALGSPSAD
ncbi:ankyrin repeat domain-containing protein [Rickettsia endosymbiont of Lasioglossum villosulum]|uniref:ankyrin repeat domain-containing protein n=1 Tax=Rickettsia endosymbiont of Lasioglossum villosulum TaxID=3066269 RepID=UPI0031331652